MTPERPSPPPPSRPGRSEPWRVQRMVQRVPAHLGETTQNTLSPWLMLAGILILLLVACIVGFALLGGTSRFGLGGAAATPTRTFTSAPAITIIPVTLPPATEPPPGPTVATIKYKVKAGDTLTAIAAHYKVSIQSIMAANGMKEDTIRIGQELTIPAPTSTPEPGAQSPPGGTPTSISFQSPPTSGTPADTPGVIRHTVQRGDTLSSIAASNGSSVDSIRAANRLNTDALSIGQVLLVPVGSWTATPTMTQVPYITATPTSQFAYAAPDLLQPQDQGTVTGSDTPMLSWTSPATLKPDEFYVVHIERSANGDRIQLPSLPVRQGNSVRLVRTTYYAGPSSAGNPYSWWVVIVTQPAGSNEPAAAQSPPSATWTFVWH